MLRSLASFLRAALAGDRDEALRQASPEMEGAMNNEFSCRMLADGYTLLGHRDEALRWLRRSIDFGFINYPCLSTGAAFLAGLRDDPEFEQMIVDIKPRWEAVVEWEALASP